MCSIEIAYFNNAGNIKPNRYYSAAAFCEFVGFAAKFMMCSLNQYYCMFVSESAFDEACGASFLCMFNLLSQIMNPTILSPNTAHIAEMIAAGTPDFAFPAVILYMRGIYARCHIS